MNNEKRINLKTLIILICCFIITFCAVFVFTFTIFKTSSTNRYITDIKKTSSNGLIDTYTITYSNGLSSFFTITNGSDGEDANDITINQVYQELVNQGYNKGFDAFLKEYLNYEQTTTNKTANINKAMLSAVSVYSEFPVKVEEPTYSYHPILGYIQSGSQIVNKTSVGAGSGVIYNLDKENGNAYIITNYHVVYNNNCVTTNKIGKVHVFLYGSTTEISLKDSDSNQDGYPDVVYGNSAIECEYIGGSLVYDIAVLKITNSEILKNSDAKNIVFAEDYSVGETAIAIGNPEAEGISVTQGIVSVDSEIITMYGVDEQTLVEFRTMRIDTAINSGNSGGGLFNEQGELIGIVNAKIVDEEIENIAYAIPRDIVKNVVENIIYNNTTNSLNCVNKIVLGVSLSSENSFAMWDNNTQTTKIYEDIVIASVDNNSLAKTLNFTPGDVIKSLKINSNTYEGENLRRYFNVIDLILNIRVGDNVTFNILRNNTNTTISFTATSEMFQNIK